MTRSSYEVLGATSVAPSAASPAKCALRRVVAGSDSYHVLGTSVGSDWFYSAAEIKDLSFQLMNDLRTLMTAAGAPGTINRIGLHTAQSLKLFVDDAVRYLTDLSSIASKESGDGLVRRREQARDWAKLLSTAGVAVGPLSPEPAQRRRDDPRDLAEQKKRDDEWSWKQYLLATALGIAVVGGVAYVGGSYLMAKVKVL